MYFVLCVVGEVGHENGWDFVASRLFVGCGSGSDIPRRYVPNFYFLIFTSPFVSLMDEVRDGVVVELVRTYCGVS